MNKKLLTILSFIFFSGAASAQTVTYDILVGDLVGLSLTSGDICSAPFTTEEARQTSIGNSWGATWTSTNGGIATSISVELSFTVADTVAMHNITLNGNPAGSVNSGPSVSCAAGTVLNWTIDPSSYNSMASNTFLVDYSNSGIVNQLDNLPYPADPYMRITVNYAGAGLGELTGETPELIKITDLTGRECEYNTNTPLIYWYADGTVERIFVTE